jgi:hypothetical protein
MSEHMNITSKIAVGCFILLAYPSAFACDYPARPSIPNGSSASRDELMLAKEDINAYLAGVDAYLICIEAEFNSAKDSLADEPEELSRRDDMLEKKFDAANDEKELVGEEFNLQVRAYNAARKAD